MASFKDLTVWQKGIELSVLVYELCEQLPTSEQYILCSQLKRAAIAIPSNISEGYRRNNTKEYRQFCGIALGSSAELETQLIIASKLYPTVIIEPALQICIEVQKILTVILSKLKSN